MINALRTQKKAKDIQSSKWHERSSDKSSNVGRERDRGVKALLTSCCKSDPLPNDRKESDATWFKTNENFFIKPFKKERSWGTIKKYKIKELSKYNA